VIAVQYIADDETAYQILLDADLAAPGAGDLPAATSQPPFPAFWHVRYLFAERTTPSGTTFRVRVPCNEANPAWQAGPGATLSIAGNVWTVIAAYGEDRPIQ
jgi:hypothetical protein